MDKKIVVVSSQDYEGVINLKLLGLKYLKPQLQIDSFDTLIFTSKNGLRALDAIESEWKTKEIFVISNESAKVANSLECNVSYISESGDGGGFADELVPLLKNKRALFVRGESVAFELGGYLKESGIDIMEAILYKSICAKPQNIELPEDVKFFIFGSPKCVECFLEYFSWQEAFVAVALGETTAKSFPKEFNYIISPHKSIQKSIDYLKEM